MILPLPNSVPVAGLFAAKSFERQRDLRVPFKLGKHSSFELSRFIDAELAEHLVAMIEDALSDIEEDVLANAIGKPCLFGMLPHVFQRDLAEHVGLTYAHGSMPFSAFKIIRIGGSTVIERGKEWSFFGQQQRKLEWEG